MSRRRLIAVLPALVVVGLAGCALQRMLPEGPVVDRQTRQRLWDDEAPSGVDYTGEADGETPLLPFLVFGLSYDLDIVLVSKHPSWEMHEYARLQTPDGPVWLAKDTRSSNGNQLLVADIPEIETWLPEIPLERKSAPVRVEDRSTSRRLDLDIAYENFDGERVEVHYEGPRPETELAKRNGSTMGHSRDQVLAVLDLPRRDFGDWALMRFDGKHVALKRALGLVPMNLALTQTQGGIPEAEFEQLPTPDNVDAAEAGSFRTRHHMPGGSVTDRRWSVERTDGHVVVEQRSALRTLRFRFLESDGGALELLEASVIAWNAETPRFHVEFSPALPDLRRPFDGEFESRFVMDVAGQKNHATGRVTARSADGETTLEIRASKPWWAADRCVTSTVGRSRIGSRVETAVEPCD